MTCWVFTKIVHTTFTLIQLRMKFSLCQKTWLLLIHLFFSLLLELLDVFFCHSKLGSHLLYLSYLFPVFHSDCNTLHFFLILSHCPWTHLQLRITLPLWSCPTIATHFCSALSTDPIRTFSSSIVCSKNY